MIEIPCDADVLARRVEPCGARQRGVRRDPEVLRDLQVVDRQVHVVELGVEHYGRERIARIRLTGAGARQVQRSGRGRCWIIARKDTDEAPRVLGDAELVRQLEAATEPDLAFDAERVGAHAHAVVDVRRHASVAAGQRDIRDPVRAVETRVARIDAGVFRDRAVVEAHRDRQVGRSTVVEVLETQPQVAGVELLRDVAADLTALLDGGVAVPWTLALTPEAADREPQAVAERSAISEIDAVLTVIDAFGQADAPALVLARVADEVDDAARRVGGERGSRSAADHFEPVEHRIDAQERVRRRKRDVTELQERQAVLLELHVARSTGGDREAADRHVGIALATAGFGSHARDLAEYVGRVGRIRVFDLLRPERAHRHALLDFRNR